eukprot:jgi/Botrbrau1/14071/Bobra.182_3s0018.1
MFSFRSSAYLETKITSTAFVQRPATTSVREYRVEWGKQGARKSMRSRGRPQSNSGPPSTTEEDREQEMYRLREEILKQIEERKRLHEELMDTLRKQGLDTGTVCNVTQNTEPYPVPPPPPKPKPPMAVSAAATPKQAAPRPTSPSPRPPPVSAVPAAASMAPAAGVAAVVKPPLPAPRPRPQPLVPEPAFVAAPAPPPSLPEPEVFTPAHASGDGGPLAGENVMNIVFVGAECAPWSKTGGLGDVMGALPKALARRGHRVMAISPRYEDYAEGWETGVRVHLSVFNTLHEVGYFHGYIDGVDFVFVDHPCFHGRKGGAIYGGSHLELLFRCALLCKAALEAPWHVPCGGVPYGDNNLVFVANDWHTALLPVYLQAHYRDYDRMTYARSVFVLHNIAHQGRGPMKDIANLEVPQHYQELFRLYDPIGGEHLNVMRAALITAHRLVAVSHGYAWECQTSEGGWGLDGSLRENSWKLRGIVNGIDYNEWSPWEDVFLRSDGYMNYSLETLKQGKAACKAALQRELGLPERPDVPLLGFVGRLDHQKGVDLITESFGWIMEQGCQLIMLGSGRHDLEEALRSLEANRRDQCRGWVGFSVQMAHRITAGSDILLMPSRFEPCGLNQLYAMAYGTVPVVHAVGGLRDTVQPYNPYENTGTGWTFEAASGHNFRNALYTALQTYREFPESFHDLRVRGMSQDLSWDAAAAQYEEQLVAAKYQW